MIIGNRKITALKGWRAGQSSALILRVMSLAFSSGNLPPANWTRWTIAVFLIPLCLEIGCAESSHQRAQRLDPMLVQSGFRAVPANTPARAQRLSEMTPLKVSYYSRNGKRSYCFADPYVCHCLYVGSEQNYDEFHELEQERAQEVTQEYDQRNFDQFMASPASQVFYGE
jgi:hypothetical protein